MIFFKDLLDVIAHSISMIGVAVISFGALRALYHFIMLLMLNKFSENYIRLQLGDSVILGLEFMVGADIIGSLAAPDYYNLGLLATIVLIRTFLSYFLSLELAALKPSQRDAIN